MVKSKKPCDECFTPVFFTFIRKHVRHMRDDKTNAMNTLVLHMKDMNNL